MDTIFNGLSGWGKVDSPALTKRRPLPPSLGRAERPCAFNEDHFIYFVFCVRMRKIRRGPNPVPKSHPDHKLQHAAQLAIRKHQSVVAAASAVGLSPATLWRIAKSGKAIPRTRATLEAWHSKPDVNKINEIAPQVQFPTSRDELLQTRRVLVTMLEFLDRYLDTSPDPAYPTNKA